eukprot:7321387-Alexandrium_andersonii.AAC.1
MTTGSTGLGMKRGRRLGWQVSLLPAMPSLGCGRGIFALQSTSFREANPEHYGFEASVVPV